jgi:hypothetical protein
MSGGTTERLVPPPASLPERAAEFAHSAMQWLDRGPVSLTTGTTALTLLLVAMAYPYFWTGNEENYFILARQWFDPASARPFDAVFDASSGKFVAFLLFGGAIDALGWDGGRLAVGLLSAIVLAYGFVALARALALSLIDVLIVLLVFLAAGQAVLGEEWFIGGIETKAFAYGFGLAALAAALDARPVRTALWIAAALYFHFLVGAFWLGCVTIAHLAARRYRDAALTVGVGLVLAIPLLYGLLGDQLRNAAVVQPAGMPGADYIYSIIRNPHHVAPFAVDGWPRKVLTTLLWSFAWAAGGAAIALRATGRLKALATTVALLSLCVPLALAVLWLDRNTGTIGKLYPLRPLSPILLLGLFVLAAAWREPTRDLPDVRQWPAWLALGALVVAVGNGSFRAVINRPPPDEVHIAAALRTHVPTDVPVLLDPETDIMPAIARLSGRQTVVSWKFVPTDTADLYRWWGRVTVRDRVFEGACPSPRNPVRYLLVGEGRWPRVAHCGRVVWTGGAYRLLALTAP